MGLDIAPFYEQQSGTWSYIVADIESGQAAVIDPVWVYDPVSGRASCDFMDQILEQVARRGWVLRWVLETHAHADHLSCAALIRAKTGAGIVIGRGICSVQETFKRVYNLADLAVDGRQFDRLVSEGEEIALGQSTITVLETPGHTNDSVTYLVGSAAFIGDTLFAPDYGSARCDFPGGDAGSLFDSVQKLYALPPETQLYLCHDYPESGQQPRSHFSVAHMRSANIHIDVNTTREAFVDLRRQRDQGLGLPRLILPALQVNVLGGQAPVAEDNGFSYLKIPFDTSIAEILRSC